MMQQHCEVKGSIRLKGVVGKCKINKRKHHEDNTLLKISDSVTMETNVNSEIVGGNEFCSID